MKEEYDLTIFDLVKGEEYRIHYNDTFIYKVEGNKLLVRGSSAKWEISAVNVNSEYKLIKKKKTVTFYNHFYWYTTGCDEYQGTSGWVKSPWQEYRKRHVVYGKNLLHTDTKAFEVDE